MQSGYRKAKRVGKLNVIGKNEKNILSILVVCSIVFMLQ